MLERIAEREHELLAIRADLERRVLKRTRDLEAISSSAQQILGTPDWRSLVLDLLRPFGEAIDADRVYLVEAADPDGPAVETVLTAQWCAGDAQPRADEPTLRQWGEALAAGRTEALAAVVTDPPPPLRSLAEARGARSVAVTLIQVSDTRWGILGFDDCRMPHRHDRGEGAGPAGGPRR